MQPYQGGRGGKSFRRIGGLSNRASPQGSVGQCYPLSISPPHSGDWHRWKQLIEIYFETIFCFLIVRSLCSTSYLCVGGSLLFANCRVLLTHHEETAVCYMPPTFISDSRLPVLYTLRISGALCLPAPCVVARSLLHTYENWTA
ncbi:unnamed protein product [Discosporangium mesarthrocarpum]